MKEIQLPDRIGLEDGSWKKEEYLIHLENLLRASDFRHLK